MARIKVEIPVEQNAAAQTPINVPEQAPANTHSHHDNRQPPNYKKFIVGLAVVIGIIFVISLIQEKNRLAEQVENAQVSETENIKNIVAQLSKSVELPAGEIPQSRTIDDASKFSEQNPALADIRNGDMLLFFEKSKKVVVYRPSNKKVVVVVTLAQPTSNQPSTGTE